MSYCKDIGKDIEYSGQDLVFIVGCPRSGTSWLQRLLSFHPKIHTGQESHIFSHYIVPCLRHWRRGFEEEGRGGVGLSCYLTEKEFISELKSFLMSLLRYMVPSITSGEIFIEKSPSHSLFLPEIMKLLPEARVIHIIRDPRDVVASLLAASKSWGSKWAPKTAGDAARMWVKHVTAVKKAGEDLNEAHFIELNYEELLRHTNKTLRRCFEFLGMEISDQDLLKTIKENDFTRAVKTGGSSITLGGEVSKIKDRKVVIEPKGFVRKGQIGSWKNDLTFKEKFMVWRVANEVMGQMGYEWRFPW